MFIPEIETKTTEEIKSFQEKLLAGTLDYVGQFSPFYKSLFKKNKIDVSKIKKIEDLKYIPTTSKEDLQHNYEDFLCVPKAKIIDYLTTSGTAGEPVIFGLTEKDLKRLTYNEYISLICADGSENDIYQIITTLDRRFMAGLAYYMGVREMGAGVVRAGAGTPEFQWDTIQRIKPTTIIVVPSFIIKLIEFAEKNGIDYKNSSVKKAVCIGDVLRYPDFSNNALAGRILEKWNLKLYSTYASTEMATAFTECSEGKGGHHHPELIIVELLDENEEPVQDGEAGEVTITTLGVEGMPLVRFKTGDICHRHTEPCECGRTTYRLGHLIGRKNQMLKVKGTTLYPPALYDILDSMEKIQNYVVEVLQNETGQDEIHVRIGAADISDIFRKEIAEHFKAKLRVVPKIIFQPPEDILAIQMPPLSRKPIKFFDKRNI